MQNLPTSRNSRRPMKFRHLTSLSTSTPGNGPKRTLYTSWLRHTLIPLTVQDQDACWTISFLPNSAVAAEKCKALRKRIRDFAKMQTSPLRVVTMPPQLPQWHSCGHSLRRCCACSVATRSRRHQYNAGKTHQLRTTIMPAGVLFIRTRYAYSR